MATTFTPAVQFSTNALFPSIRKDDEAGWPALYSDPNAKILIESHAEFMQYDIPGSKYGTKADLVLLHDQKGQPLVLSIGSDKRLYICAYVNGGSGSWQTFDITPDRNFDMKVCNASQNPSHNGILVAVSGYDRIESAKTKLYHVTFECPRLVADGSGKIESHPFHKLPWLDISPSISHREVKTLVCEYFGGDHQYHILASVTATTREEGSHYLYSPSKAKEWKLLEFPQQVEKVHSCVPANLSGLGTGHFILFEDKTVSKTVSCLYQGEGVAKQIFLEGLQNPRKLSVSLNKQGTTDLFIAADNGLGFVDNKKTIKEPRILLEGIACRHAYCSESSNSRYESSLLIHVVSTHGELFVVRGSRNTSRGNIVTFNTIDVPIPIRSNVRDLAGSINPLTGASDIVYVSRDTDILKRLTRDNETTIWNETEMVVQHTIPNTRTKTPAFVVTISLSDGKGVPVPAQYQLKLTSSPCMVYINGRSYELCRRPQVVQVNELGQLHIVLPTPDSVSAAPIGIQFMSDTNEHRTFNIQPAERVLYTLGGLTTGESLKNAKTVAGQPFFSDSMKQNYGDRFDQAAAILSKAPLMVTSAESGASEAISEDTEEMIIAWQKDESETSNPEANWISGAVDTVGSVLGDAIEYLKIAVKGVAKVALTMLGASLRLVLKVGAKVIRFVVDSVSGIVTSLTYFLEGAFGMDLSSIRELFLFRYKKVEATQKELAFVINSGLSLTSRFLHRNHDILESGIDSLGQCIEAYISRPYAATEAPRNESFGNSIFNNPIITHLMSFNPLNWVLESVAEEFGEDFQVPSLSLDIGGQILGSLKEQIDLLLGFLGRSWASLKAAIGKPEVIMHRLRDTLKDGFWTIFASLKKVILAVYSLLMNSFDSITEFCCSRWRIPSITDLWEDFTNTDFTLINFISYVAAQILELFNTESGSLFKGLGLSACLENIDETKIPSILPTSHLESPIGDIKSTDNALSEHEKSTSHIPKATVTLEATSLVEKPQQYSSTEATEFPVSMLSSHNNHSPIAANALVLPAFDSLISAERPQLPMISSDSEPVDESNPAGTRLIIAFARSGKALSRCLNVAIEGLCLQGSRERGIQESNGSFNGRTETFEMTDVSSSATPLDMESTASDSLTVSNSSAISLPTGISKGVATSQKASGLGSVKPLVVGSNAFALACRVVEYYLMNDSHENYFQDTKADVARKIELLASFIGLALCLYADLPPALALSNFITSTGSFASSCMAQEFDILRVSELTGSACSAVSSCLFLIKEPFCQTAGWIGVGIDAVNTCLLTGNAFYEAQHPYTSKSPNETPFKGGKPKETGTGAPPLEKGKPPQPVTGQEPEKEDPKKKVKRVVDQPSETYARAIDARCEAIKRKVSDYFQATDSRLSPTPGPLADMLGNVPNPLVLVIHGMEWLRGVECSNAAVLIYHQKVNGQGGFPPVLTGIRELAKQQIGNDLVVEKVDPYLATLQVDFHELREKLEELRDYVAHNWEEVEIVQ